LKAQSQCNATIEALDKMTRQGTQTIKHVHVDNRGGQAVISDTVQIGGKLRKTTNNPVQSTQAAPRGLAMTRKGTEPIASRERQEAM